MESYIDKNLLKTCVYILANSESPTIKQIIAIVDNISGLNIVKCKNCKYSRSYFIANDSDNYYRCCDNEHGLYSDVADDDFCSYGEEDE